MHLCTPSGDVRTGLLICTTPNPVDKPTWHAAAGTCMHHMRTWRQGQPACFSCCHHQCPHAQPRFLRISPPFPGRCTFGGLRTVLLPTPTPTIWGLEDRPSQLGNADSSFAWPSPDLPTTISAHTNVPPRGSGLAHHCYCHKRCHMCHLGVWGPTCHCHHSCWATLPGGPGTNAPSHPTDTTGTHLHLWGTCAKNRISASVILKNQVPGGKRGYCELKDDGWT